jgi:hypothetical protein
MLDYAIGDACFPAFRFTHRRVQKFDKAKDGAAIFGRKQGEDLGRTDGTHLEAEGWELL